MKLKASMKSIDIKSKIFKRRVCKFLNFTIYILYIRELQKEKPCQISTTYYQVLIPVTNK